MQWSDRHVLDEPLAGTLRHCPLTRCPPGGAAVLASRRVTPKELPSAPGLSCTSTLYQSAARTARAPRPASTTLRCGGRQRRKRLCRRHNNSTTRKNHRRRDHHNDSRDGRNNRNRPGRNPSGRGFPPVWRSAVIPSSSATPTPPSYSVMALNSSRPRACDPSCSTCRPA